MSAEAADERFMLSGDRVHDERKSIAAVSTRATIAVGLPNDHIAPSFRSLLSRLRQKAAQGKHRHLFSLPIHRLCAFDFLKFYCVQGTHARDARRPNSIELIAGSNDHTLNQR